MVVTISISKENNLIWSNFLSRQEFTTSLQSLDGLGIIFHLLNTFGYSQVLLVRVVKRAGLAHLNLTRLDPRNKRVKWADPFSPWIKFYQFMILNGLTRLFLF